MKIIVHTPDEEDMVAVSFAFEIYPHEVHLCRCCELLIPHNLDTVDLLEWGGSGSRQPCFRCGVRSYHWYNCTFRGLAYLAALLKGPAIRQDNDR